MAIVRITTTRDQLLQALGTAGQTAAQSWSVLQTLLASRLGEAHARLIAEPAANPSQGETDWYADIDTAVRPLAALSPEEQSAARATLDRLVSDTLALAAELGAARDESSQFLGAMLELTVQIPSEEYIYVAELQPILVAWGHAKAGPAIDRVFLRGARSVASRPMTILRPPIAPRPKPPSTAVPLAASLAAALALFGVVLYVLWGDPFHWYSTNVAACTLSPGQLEARDTLRDATARETELRAQLAQLVRDAGARRLQCRPIVPAVVPPPPSRDVRRATEAGGHAGKLRIVLAWDDRNDLDLHVFCPGAHLFWHDRSVCGGSLDVDANGDARTANASPVENAYFDSPAPGQYRIVIDPFAMRVSRSTDFRLTIQQEGKPDQVLTGTATLGARLQEITTVTVDPAP